MSLLAAEVAANYPMIADCASFFYFFLLWSPNFSQIDSCIRQFDCVFISVLEEYNCSTSRLPGGFIKQQQNTFSTKEASVVNKLSLADYDNFR